MTTRLKGIKRLRIIKRASLLFLVIFCACFPAAAQYYDTGQTPAGQRWMHVRGDSLRMVFPREFDRNARETMFYMDSVRPHIGCGLGRGPLKTPVVFKTENFYSNGLGILAPKRIEMVGMPSTDSYSTPWLKQLAVHEYRHMVQYGSVNRNTVKALSYVLGQQVTLVATGLLPFWFIEGDAVMAETQMSAYGRALQPSFTMHYRALGREILEKRNPDKWFAGSYKDYVPNHYELGYQIVAWSQEKYGRYIWGDVAEYTSKYPFLIFTTQLGLKKYGGIYTKQLFRETFTHLNDFWDSLPDAEDSARLVTATPDSYTTYSHPVFIDGNTIMALKTDLHRPSRFVRIDTVTGREEHVAWTGTVSSRPVCRDGVMWWSEYRQSALWEQKTHSYIYNMDVVSGRVSRFPGPGNAFYPTPATDGSLAYITYDSDGTYSYVHGETVFGFGHGYSVHGLAWDDTTQRPYFILLGDEGMFIVCLEGGSLRKLLFPVTTPSHVTIADLRAHDDRLYFNSILSGRDEAHMIDLVDRREYRITGSRFGSFSPSPSPDGNVASVTVYSRSGYRVALQDVGLSNEIIRTTLPDNLVNPPLARWDVPNIDEVKFTEADLSASKESKPARRYRRLPHAISVHSWAPVYFEPENIINGTDFNIYAGATLVSQSLLGDAVSSLGYGYVGGGNSMVRAKVNYLGSVPKFTVSATWSDSGQVVRDKPNDAPEPGRLKDYFMVSARAYLPILLSGGYFSGRLTPSVEYLFQNSLRWDRSHNDYIKNDDYIAASVQYSGNVRMAELDLWPRWGYVVRAGVIGRPWNDRFSSTVSLYGRIYTPGIVRHHGFSLAASRHAALDKVKYAYAGTELTPRGYTGITSKNYFSASASYILPVAYPDWGLSGVFFLKRIALTAGFDYAKYIPNAWDFDPRRPLWSDGTDIWSWGGSLNLDVSFFRLPSQGAVTITVSCFVDRNGRAVVTSGFSVPL